jgi:hypothetical protein
MGVLGVPVGDAGLRELVRLRSRMEDPLPGDLPRADAFRGRSHAFGTEIGGVSQNTGQHRWNALRRFLGADVREPVGKSSPIMHLHQEVRHLDQRIHVTEFPFQLLSSGRYIAGEGSDDELSGLKPDAFELAITGAIGEPLQVEVERLTCLGKVGNGILWHTEPEIV